MARRISAKRRAALIRDLINANFDLTSLHEKYALSPDNLSQWIQEEKNHRCLAGLCVLADLQTQLLLSRYRLLAAGKLIELATGPPEDSKAGVESARRACVDLLKLDLKRADIVAEPSVPLLEKPDQGADSLRRLLYDSADSKSTLAFDGDGDHTDNTNA